MPDSKAGNILLELKRSFLDDKKEIQDKIVDIETEIRQCKDYIESLNKKDENDYNMFSPRSASRVYKDQVYEKRIEIEDYISNEEYYAYLNRRDCVQGMISKDRYCLAWHWQYFELDVYPFWADKATIEIELLSEDQPFELPDFLTLIRDVSYEKEFRNKQLAVKYGRYLFE